MLKTAPLIKCHDFLPVIYAAKMIQRYSKYDWLRITRQRAIIFLRILMPMLVVLQSHLPTLARAVVATVAGLQEVPASIFFCMFVFSIHSCFIASVETNSRQEKDAFKIFDQNNGTLQVDVNAQADERHKFTGFIFSISTTEHVHAGLKLSADRSKYRRTKWN